MTTQLAEAEKSEKDTPKRTNGAAAKVKSKKKPQKKQKRVVAGPDEEKGLALVEAPETEDKTYKPGSFNKSRLDYIAKLRQDEKISHAAAQQRWMMSDERADLLSELPAAELKRRRFVPTGQ